MLLSSVSEGGQAALPHRTQPKLILEKLHGTHVLTNIHQLEAKGSCTYQPLCAGLKAGSATALSSPRDVTAAPLWPGKQPTSTLCPGRHAA